MDKKQYNNIINWTLKTDERAKKCDDLTKIRAICNNMGVALPQGDFKEIRDILKNNNYMGWRACTHQQAHKMVNNGTAVIAVSENNIAIVLADTDDEMTVATIKSGTPAVMMMSDDSTTSKDYYGYSNTTITESDDNSESSSCFSGSTAIPTQDDASEGSDSMGGSDESGSTSIPTIDNEGSTSLPTEDNTTTSPYQLVDNGTYYVNNNEYGKYLSSSSIISVISGKLSELGNSIKWTITKIDSGYIIRPYNNTSLYLSVHENATSNSVFLKNISAGEQISNNSIWNITFAIGSGGVAFYIKSVQNSRYLTYNGSSIVTTTGTSDNSDAWRMVGINDYGNSPSYDKCELDSNCSIDDINMNVGDTQTPQVKNISSNTIWSEETDFYYEIPSNAPIKINDGKIFGTSQGNVTVVATHKVTGISKSFNVKVMPLLIYQTRFTEVNWFEENASTVETLRPDLYHNDKSREEILASIPCIDGSDFSYYQTDYYTGQVIECVLSVSERKQKFLDMCNSYFAKGEFESIVTDMIEHFLGENTQNFNGTIEGFNIYSNTSLTNKVINHPESTSYVENIKNAIANCLNECSGNLSSLIYDPETRTDYDLRKQQAVVKELASANVQQPCFNSPSDRTEGFTICLDTLQGNKIEILSYNLEGQTYTGTMRITYYDHFGLDDSDMLKDTFSGLVVQSLLGFKQWYILQHWEDIASPHMPKPFITTIEFTKPFAGVIEQT